jgi:hypothetical protein
MLIKRNALIMNLKEDFYLIKFWIIRLRGIYERLKMKINF